MGQPLGTNKSNIINHLRDLSQNFSKKNIKLHFACPTREESPLSSCPQKSEPPASAGDQRCRSPNVSKGVIFNAASHRIAAAFMPWNRNPKPISEAACRRLLVACSARSDVVGDRVTQGCGRGGLTLGYILCPLWGLRHCRRQKLRTSSGLCPLAVRSGSPDR